MLSLSKSTKDYCRVLLYQSGQRRLKSPANAPPWESIGGGGLFIRWLAKIARRLNLGRRRPSIRTNAAVCAAKWRSCYCAGDVKCLSIVAKSTRSRTGRSTSKSVRKRRAGRAERRTRVRTTLQQTVTTSCRGGTSHRTPSMGNSQRRTKKLKERQATCSPEQASEVGVIGGRTV